MFRKENKALTKGIPTITAQFDGIKFLFCTLPLFHRPALKKEELTTKRTPQSM